MNEQILKVSAGALVAEFLQRPCEVQTTARGGLLTVNTHKSTKQYPRAGAAG
jgi:hypothetical protein